jgi:hypothetical protein
MAWIGLAMVIGSVSPIAGGFVFVGGGAITIGILVIGLIRGAWRFPTAVRLIGDPEAWRGNRHPYWEKAPRTSA